MATEDMGASSHPPQRNQPRSMGLAPSGSNHLSSERLQKWVSAGRGLGSSSQLEGRGSDCLLCPRGEVAYLGPHGRGTVSVRYLRGTVVSTTGRACFSPLADSGDLKPELSSTLDARDALDSR